jgi:hypothetical protein
MFKQTKKYISEHSMQAHESEGPRPEANNPRGQETHLQPIRGRHTDSRAHLVDQTSAPKHESPRINTRAHLPANLRNAKPGRFT